MMQRHHTVRRNPRARPAPKHPMVVLVRRFDPTGEELSRWEVLARDADGRPEFFSQTAAKKAALNPPTTGDGADLHIGDLIATMPAEAAGYDEHATGLYVVTPDGVKAAPKPPGIMGSWLTGWGKDASVMLRTAKGADRQRLTMAACDCAETVIGHAWSTKARGALSMARAWCRGATSAYDVGYAAYDTKHPRERPNSADLAAAHAAGVVAGGSAQLAAEDAAESFAWWADGAGTHRSHVARHLAAMAPLVERWIPLPVVLLAKLGYPGAIPFDPSMVPASSTGPRPNPAHPIRSTHTLPRSRRR